MSVRVQVPGALRSVSAGAAEVEIDAADIASLVAGLEAKHPGFRERLLDANGKLRGYVRVFVNQQPVKDTSRALQAGDVVAIVPAIAGGAQAAGAAPSSITVVSSP